VARWGYTRFVAIQFAFKANSPSAKDLLRYTNPGIVTISSLLELLSSPLIATPPTRNPMFDQI